jgi:hypothetical protein
MRIVALALLVGGCIISESGDTDYYPPPDNGGGWGSGWGGGGGTSGYGCLNDAACPSGFACARDGNCVSPSQLRVVHVNWTLRDRPASEMTCAASVNLAITFTDTMLAEFGFAPVPCKAGRYTVDKMPLRYTSVTLARSGDSYGAGGTFDSAGDAFLNLPY